ncbi:hypothetical protein [Halopiger aswanensis]|nr:hypothetical protein [Halopiger aswanensis]
MEKDWDNLIILDACRYDLFKQVNTIEGELRSVISSDSSTSGFLQYNFSDNEFPDTVYISANPQVQRHEVGEQFHDCIRLWEGSWDNELHTVLPDDVTERALRAHKQYPQKRLIIHYVQPHYPFIGETGQQIEHGTLTGDGVIKNEREVESVWDQLEKGIVEQETVWKAYRENLELVIPEVKKLLNGMNGKSVITSDHGNTFGRFGIYGHPGGTFLKSLVTVPWLEKEKEPRREIETGEIRPNDNGIESDVSDRLADLGYVYD